MAETTGSIIRGPGSRNRNDETLFDPFGWEEERDPFTESLEETRRAAKLMREHIDRKLDELWGELLTGLRAQAPPLLASLEGDTRLGIAAPDDPGVCSEPRRTSRNVVIRDGIPTIRQGHKEIRHRLKP